MYPHLIRLRGPWQCEVLNGQPHSSHHHPMPACWETLGLAGFEGRVRFTRRFGYPGQIDSEERVWLTFADLACPCAVSLNGSLLVETASTTPWLELDVTSLLQPRNELRLEMTGPIRGEQPWTEVALEVRCLAFLRGVEIMTVPVEGQVELEVRGEVVGAADRPLDLYVILDRSPSAYDRVQPRPEGQPFTLRCRELPPERMAGQPMRVQIDLVSGATVWYTLIRQLA
jgi:hypothetical protein